MRPSSLGGGHIMRRTLSVCLSVCLSVRLSVCLLFVVVVVCLSVRPVIVAIGHVFSAPLASRMYFSARTEGRISYSHLGRTDSCYVCHCHCSVWKMNMMVNTKYQLKIYND